MQTNKDKNLKVVKSFRQSYFSRPLLVGWFIVFLVAVVLQMFYMSFFSPSLKSIEEQTISFQLEIAKKAKNRIDWFMGENERNMNNLAHNLTLVNEDIEKKALLDQFLNDNVWIQEVSVANAQGKELHKQSQQEVIASEDLKDLSNEEKFKVAAQGNIYISKVYADASGMPAFELATPIKNSPDQITGVLTVNLSFKEIWKILADLDAEENLKTYLVDSNGYIIAKSDTLHLHLPQEERVTERAIVSKVIYERRFVAENNPQLRYKDEEGKEYFAVGIPMDREGWGLFVEQESINAWEDYSRIRLSGMLLGLVTAILILTIVLNNRRLSVAFKELEESRKSLDTEVYRRTQELNELDKTSKMLVRRDLELNLINEELDQKVTEVERSKKTLMAAYRALEGERNKTLSIISNFLDPIVVVDEDNRLSLFNKAAKDILGMKDSDFGREIPDRNHFEVDNFQKVIREAFTAKRIEFQKAKQVLIEEVSLAGEKKDGVYKVVTSKIVGPRGDYLGTMKIFHDLTREKMIDKMKSEFISIAAHQLRTPLSAIKWVIQMLLDEDAGALTADQKELLEKGFKSNERMIELVNDLLNVSRIEEGRFGFDFKPTQFTEVINTVIENLEKLIARNHLDVTMSKPDDLPDVVIDKERMILVMQNLIENALKYTPEYGSIKISIDFLEKEHMRVSVKDNGVGIPEGDKEKIFSKFFRAANVIRMETEGSGLGLFIVKNIIERHGGKIKVASTEGKGTEISFTLPIKH